MTKQTSEITLSKSLMEDAITCAYRAGWVAHKEECKKISAIPKTEEYRKQQMLIITDISERYFPDE